MRGLAALALLVFFMGTAQAQQLAGSQDRLQMLKKIQGSWLRDCEQVVSAGRTVFEQTRLGVDFTKLVFSTKEYSNRECSLVVREYKTEYRYSLGDSIPVDAGQTAYELNLTPVSSPEGIIRLPLKNLIHFNNGYLYFGLRDIQLKPEERLTHLDRQLTFQRY